MSESSEDFSEKVASLESRYRRHACHRPAVWDSFSDKILHADCALSGGTSMHAAVSWGRVTGVCLCEFVSVCVWGGGGRETTAVGLLTADVVDLCKLLIAAGSNYILPFKGLTHSRLIIALLRVLGVCMCVFWEIEFPSVCVCQNAFSPFST